MRRILIACLALLATLTPQLQAAAPPPVRFAMIGLSHDHAMNFLPRLAGRTDIQLVGIVETNSDLIDRYSERFHLSRSLFFPDLKTLLAHTNLQAVATFTSVYDHERVVETCVRHGLDVMMEKPLAANLKQARAIAAAAKKSGIQVFVNYETSWYPGTQAAYALVHDQRALGPVWKMVFHDGHRGPKEIGCSTNFLAWLTDPVLDGGGAINDFGCYGADLATWFFDGEKPVSVFAVAQHLKPDVYPKVEDNATIILNYPGAQVILEPSWNWPVDRKDMEIYGRSGQLLLPQPDLMQISTFAHPETREVTPPALTGALADPVSYFVAVVRGTIKPTGPASLDTNLTVMEILDAAHRSVQSGKEVKL
ncbi:MAG TPA: Gfo/Idh/MocA family oxidoreductase [Verrucomicrobiae bacterium]|nr:Gfo/Idh/MocA family oxidoreductase [Verrucomicrobiae bacterium]